ncbi:hypothetical protein SCP_0302780 [Sparassis crispa]|uniref:Uncharacterized protein n=1 Tax=Sparassis crispa TaxID=139825 RepID=A0A401GEN8_9APHY|nr:hypothetical protein SCP_0302780 [Sparassis crispa]GBE80563.1 hypothetical protein SCP_0302780 [Sparassis crispa]
MSTEIPSFLLFVLARGNLLSTTILDEKVLVGSQNVDDARHNPSLRLPLKVWERLKRIALLLATGYASRESRTRYEITGDWYRFRSTTTKKLENIGIVSGLLLSSSTSLLSSGDLRRMTYIATIGSMACSLLSIIFGLLCLWSLVGVDPTRLKSLSRNSALFYYLYATPSLFGGTAALSFFVAVGSWTWLDLGHSHYGSGGKVLSICCSAALVFNAALCFILGGSTWRSQPSSKTAC